MQALKIYKSCMSLVSQPGPATAASIVDSQRLSSCDSLERTNYDVQRRTQKWNLAFCKARAGQIHQQILVNDMLIGAFVGDCCIVVEWSEVWTKLYWDSIVSGDSYCWTLSKDILPILRRCGVWKDNNNKWKGFIADVHVPSVERLTRSIHGEALPK